MPTILASSANWGLDSEAEAGFGSGLLVAELTTSVKMKTTRTKAKR